MAFLKRISVISADMFSDEWPRGFDIHLLSHVLHDWDINSCTSFFCRNHLTRSSRAGFLPFMTLISIGKKQGLSKQRNIPILLMLSTRGKCYSIEEMRKLLQGYRIYKSAY